MNSAYLQMNRVSPPDGALVVTPGSAVVGGASVVAASPGSPITKHLKPLPFPALSDSKLNQNSYDSALASVLIPSINSSSFPQWNVLFCVGTQ